MKWIVLGIAAGVVAWFEYDYQQRRHAGSWRGGRLAAVPPVPESAHVECAGDIPSISPGSENDKKLNTIA
jgi:hypothetical protein